MLKKPKKHVEKPNDFSGEKKDYRAFKRQIKLFVSVNHADFKTDYDKVLFILSLMKGKFAVDWAANFIDQHNLPLVDYTFFEHVLDTTFVDPNKQKNAQQKLETLYQGNWTAEEYFLQFEQYRMQAGFDFMEPLTADNEDEPLTYKEQEEQ